jgi:hypothetical protein
MNSSEASNAPCGRSFPELQEKLLVNVVRSSLKGHIKMGSRWSAVRHNSFFNFDATQPTAVVALQISKIELLCFREPQNRENRPTTNFGPIDA